MTATAPRPGVCAEHGGLMWDHKRVCLTPDDVIRGGCRWSPSGVVDVVEDVRCSGCGRPFTPGRECRIGGECLR